MYQNIKNALVTESSPKLSCKHITTIKTINLSTRYFMAELGHVVSDL